MEDLGIAGHGRGEENFPQRCHAHGNCNVQASWLRRASAKGFSVDGGMCFMS